MFTIEIHWEGNVYKRQVTNDYFYQDKSLFTVGSGRKMQQFRREGNEWVYVGNQLGPEMVDAFKKALDAAVDEWRTKIDGR